ncbi:DUF4123 domain-containing protein [Paraburkholderia guartelaensis]|uniref:DUF4123 domain-containing protein n=1 Tax=Paraburkholderia guartelaensis TaxID=2546446 RepID=A0ABU9S3W6_9BURK
MHMTHEMTAPVADVQGEQGLIEVLRNAITVNGGKCILAVDPSLRELEDDPSEGAFFSQMNRTPVPVPHAAFPAESEPYLLELDTSTEAGVALLTQSVRIALADRQPESVARGQGQRVGGWLLGAESTQDVAAHWTGQLIQIDDLGYRRLLRFYDTRVLALMWPVLAPPQRRCLLGPVQAWYALDAQAELTFYTAPGVSQLNLRLHDTQWAEFHRHGVVNRALALFMNEVGRQPSQQEIQTAVGSAARAERHGLQDHEDKLVFVGHALAWNPDFDTHPAMASVFRNVSQGVLYCAAVSELAPLVVQEIQRGAWLKASQTGTVSRVQRLTDPKAN